VGNDQPVLLHAGFHVLAAHQEGQAPMSKPTYTWAHALGPGIVMVVGGLIYLHGNDFGQNYSPMGRAVAGGVTLACGIILLGVSAFMYQLQRQRRG
jgi:hypothetical protein